MIKGIQKGRLYGGIIVLSAGQNSRNLVVQLNKSNLIKVPMWITNIIKVYNMSE